MKKQLSKVVAATLVVSSVPAVVFADTTSEKLVGKDRFETAIKISKSNWKTSDTVVLVNEKAIADALSITPLAEEKNAPILLTAKDSLNKLTKEEIKRLGAKNIILVGGTSVLSEKLERELKELNLNIDRISGKNREETSLEILKRIDKINDISEIVVVNGTTGLADAVSIASIAAKNNMGIILANPKNGVKVFEEFIKNEDIKKSYVIGGDKVLPNKLVEKLPAKERLSGANRTETNIKILEKFYSAKRLNAIYVAKDGMGKENQLVDALAIGVVAAKNNSPVIIVSKGLKDYQRDYVNAKKIDKVVQVGGNGNEKAYEEILNIQKSKIYEVDSLKELSEALSKADANDKIVINFDTDEDIVIDTDSSVDIENNGNLGQVTLDDSNADITNNGSIDTLEIKDSDDTEIKNEGKIDKVEIGRESSNVEIDNSGNIGNVENNGEDTKIDNEGKIDKVTGDKTPSIEGNKPSGSTGGGTGGGSTEVVEKSYTVNEGNFKEIIKNSKDNKSKIIFTNKIPIDINSNEMYSDVKDLSANGDKTVMSYTADNTLYIAANGKVLAPENMSSMFSGFSGTKIDLSSLDTSQVTDMSNMFRECNKLTSLNINQFNTEKVIDMSNMFSGCNELTGLDVRQFNTEKVTDMRYMFHECRNLIRLDLTSFKTDNVIDMSNMFSRCSELESLDLSSFKTDKVTNMLGMFNSCSKLRSLDLSSFKTDKVTNMYSMFYYCSELESLDLSSFNTSNVIDTRRMLEGCHKLSGSITIMNPAITDYSNMFKETSTAEGSKFTVNYIDEETKKVATEMVNTKSTNSNVSLVEGYTFNKDKFKNLITADVTKIVFEKDSIENLPDDKVNISEKENGRVFAYKEKVSDKNILHIVSDIKIFAPQSTLWMFDGFKGTEIDLSNLDTSQVTDMRNMFTECINLKSLNLSLFDTANVTTMTSMFYGCNNLESLNLSSFDTAKVIDMNSMFSGCINLKSLDLSSFNTDKVTDMRSMLKKCCHLSGNITIMNSNINYYNDMFYETSTAEGAQFIVNYTTGCGGIVDNILNNTNGNVIKGEEVTFPPATTE